MKNVVTNGYFPVRMSVTTGYLNLKYAAIPGEQNGELFNECWSKWGVNSVSNVGISGFTKK